MLCFSQDIIILIGDMVIGVMVGIIIIRFFHIITTVASLEVAAGGGDSGGSSCACACACAGGGRAGCSLKDFYSTKLTVEKINKIL